MPTVNAAAVDVILRDGSTLRLRSPGSDDQEASVDFFRSLSERSLYLRFHGFPKLRTASRCDGRGSGHAHENLVAAAFPHAGSVAAPMAIALAASSIRGMRDIFDKVVCGVDDSKAGVLAARIGARVALPDGELTLVSVETTKIAVHAGWQMAAVSAQIAGEALEALEHGREAAGPEHAADSRLLSGDPVQCLLSEIERRSAGVIVVGSHGFSRGVGIALGSTATYMLHEAPCSVLIARAPRSIDRWPRSIVVGIDGSPESVVAARTARRLAGRFSAEVREIAAEDGHVDLKAGRAVSPDLEVLPGKPVDELTVLSEFSDLVVVGSRGLKGVRALGSVSERVAHQARCPVLVVRVP
jgi:nucleotide-binding universal stress UspA family protein